MKETYTLKELSAKMQNNDGDLDLYGCTSLMVPTNIKARAIYGIDGKNNPEKWRPLKLKIIK